MKIYLTQKYDLTDKDLVSVFDELPLWSSYFGSYILDKVIFKNSINILDIGSGTGFPLIEIAQRFGDTSHAYGIDPWSSAVERVNLKLRTMQIKNVTMIEGNAEELPFPDNYFSLIISNNGINNVQDQAKVLSECYRVSREDVQFIITANLPLTMIEFYNVFETVLQENRMYNEILKIKEHIFSKRKSIETTIEMISQSGFKVHEITENKFFMRFINCTTMFNHYFIKLAFLESWCNLVPLELRDNIFNLIEERLNLLASEQGELTLTIPFACFDLRRK